MIGVFESCGFQQHAIVVQACPSLLGESMIASPQRGIRTRHVFLPWQREFHQNRSFFVFLNVF